MCDPNGCTSDSGERLPGLVAFRTMSLERVHALNVLGGAAGIHGKRVAALAIKGRIPTISTTREFAGDGV
jgi:hypothetical protein